MDNKIAVVRDFNVDSYENYRCGIRRWTPNWLQKLNTITSFVTCYVVLSVIYGMSNSYISSMIPSIEKRFGFTSTSIGVILAVNDISHVLVALITAHFGGRGHRPRLISLGCLLLGVSLLMHALPEIFFPRNTLSNLSLGTSSNDEMLCSGRQSVVVVVNSTDIVSDLCKNIGKTQTGPLAVLGAAQFLLGIGSTTLIILGLPFIDDNSDKKNTPIYFAISFSGRIFGPVLGYALGAFCNSIYLDWSDPGFKQTDPRWISAWYLGFLFTGTGLCIFAFTMGCFPAVIPPPIATRKEEPSIKETLPVAVTATKAISWHELPRDVKRLLTNGAYMCRACTAICDGLLIAGYINFFPKFLGLHFHVSPSTASLAGGIPSVLGLALGVITGGIIIRRFNIQPGYIGAALAITALLLSSIFYGAIGLGCEKTSIYGVGSTSGTSCPSAQSCACPETTFGPVCDKTTGINYLSPCHAGCRSVMRMNQTKHYYGCSCDLSSTLEAGLCPKKCHNFYVFVSLMFLGLFATGLPLSGSIMIKYRIVDPDLKSLATGMTALLMSGFGFLPGPIITGAIVDSTCKLWQIKSCGERGFCLLYDTDDLRWKLHLLFGTVKLVAALLDIGVTFKVWRLKFDRSDEDSAKDPQPASSIRRLTLAFLGTNEHNIPPVDDRPRMSHISHIAVESFSKV